MLYCNQIKQPFPIPGSKTRSWDLLHYRKCSFKDACWCFHVAFYTHLHSSTEYSASRGGWMLPRSAHKAKNSQWIRFCICTAPAFEGKSCIIFALIQIHNNPTLFSLFWQVSITRLKPVTNLMGGGRDLQKVTLACWVHVQKLSARSLVWEIRDTHREKLNLVWRLWTEVRMTLVFYQEEFFSPPKKSFMIVLWNRCSVLRVGGLNMFLLLLFFTAPSPLLLPPQLEGVSPFPSSAGAKPIMNKRLMQMNLEATKQHFHC